MDSFSIGLSGLDAALKGLDVVGNNIANAATEGYHRQRVDFTPAYSVLVGDTILGGGVDINQIRRLVDTFLEQEIIQQRSASEQISQELSTLRTIESAFGEFTAEGTLGTAIDAFFSAMHGLSTQPDVQAYQAQVVNTADAMASQFRTTADFLTRLENQIVLEAADTVNQINILINQIAELNGKIQSLELGGGQANNLRDQRDARIAELATLVGVQTVDREYGVVDVSVSGIPVVTGTSILELEVSVQAGGLLGYNAAGASSYRTTLQGGRLGGLLALKNELLSDVHSDLDSLATAIIQQINQYHVQGAGSAGSFSQLSGWSMTSGNLADFDPPVSDGAIYFRLINESTGAVSRESIAIDASTDTLSSIATDITNNITGLTASVDSSNTLSITASGYKFDFLPAVLSAPTASTLTGTSTPTISGIYTGSTNQTFTCTVVGDGEVGNDGSLQIEVRDGASQLVATLNVGTGYAAGDRLHIGDGIYVSLSTGTLNNGEDFEIDVFANTDTSGVVAAVGLNAFFSGTSALNIAVHSDISTAPGRIATALGADMTDNTNALRMAGLRDVAVSSLNNLTPGEFYRNLVTQLGQDIATKDMQHDNTEVLMQALISQQDETSGVDINEQAAEMLVFERMFQAMAKYINAAQSYYETLLQLL